MDDAILYRHNATVGPDGNLVHGTSDTKALILHEYPNGDVAVVAFPVGGPVIFTTARAFDPDDPYLVTGGEYIREPGDPPDFSDRFALSNHPEMAALVAKQTRERNAAPGDQREDLANRHRQEQSELADKIGPKADKPEPQENRSEAQPPGQPVPGVQPRNEVSGEPTNGRRA